MPALSIITISLNEADSIESTLKSVADQTFDDIEYIVIDGGSTDGTLEIIRNYRESISKFITEPDKGIYDAQNKGIRESAGDYLLFLNAGDMLNGSNIIAEVFDKDPNADIVFGDLLILMDNGILFKKYVPEKVTSAYIFNDAFPMHPASLIKRSLFEKTGLYDESYFIAADYDFFLKAMKEFKCSMQKVDIPISIFNTAGVSQSRKMRRLSMEERREIQKKYFSDKTIAINSIISPVYKILIKKPRYLSQMVKSKISKKYLGSEID